MDRKRQLKEQYKQMKPDMGIMIVRSQSEKWCYLEGTQNLRATMNGTPFKLKAGFHPSRELLKKWQEHQGSNLTFDVLEQLEYDKDETKTDYSDELALMLMEWQERLTEDGYTVVLR